jgi:3-isopropylmalate/(R)-2-methylmalate dehydratase small subunit
VANVNSDTKITVVSGTALPLRGNDIDTDRIIPARYLKEITFARMGEYPFFDERFDAEGKLKPHLFNDPKYKSAAILLVNKNFGCGSSREHAPQALLRFGIRAIVGESFAAIFAGNCLMLGVPTVTVPASEIDKLMQLVEHDPQINFTLDLQAKRLFSGGEVAVAFDVPESARKALMGGYWDSTAVLRANLDKVKSVAAGLPYMAGFKP